MCLNHDALLQGSSKSTFSRYSFRRRSQKEYSSVVCIPLIMVTIVDDPFCGVSVFFSSVPPLGTVQFDCDNCATNLTQHLRNHYILSKTKFPNYRLTY